MIIIISGYWVLILYFLKLMIVPVGKFGRGQLAALSEFQEWIDGLSE